MLQELRLSFGTMTQERGPEGLVVWKYLLASDHKLVTNNVAICIVLPYQNGIPQKCIDLAENIVEMLDEYIDLAVQFLQKTFHKVLSIMLKP